MTSSALTVLHLRQCGTPVGAAPTRPAPSPVVRLLGGSESGSWGEGRILLMLGLYSFWVPSGSSSISPAGV